MTTTVKTCPECGGYREYYGSEIPDPCEWCYGTGKLSNRDWSYWMHAMKAKKKGKN